MTSSQSTPQASGPPGTRSFQRTENQITAAVVAAIAAMVVAVTYIPGDESVRVDFNQLMPGPTAHEVTLVGFVYTPVRGWRPLANRSRIVFHRPFVRPFRVEIDLWRRNEGAPVTIVVRSGGIEKRIEIDGTRRNHALDFAGAAATRTIEIEFPPGVELGVADLVVATAARSTA